MGQIKQLSAEVRISGFLKTKKKKLKPKHREKKIRKQEKRIEQAYGQRKSFMVFNWSFRGELERKFVRSNISRENG